MRTPVAAAVGAAAVLLAACTGASGGEPTPSDTTITSVVTQTRTVAPTYVPPPARTVPPLAGDLKPPQGEKVGACPYIASTPADNPQTNIADLDGSHVYRTTVVTTLHPIGCRFYFWGPFYAIVDIVPRTFATAAEAHNAMVLTAEKTGSQAQARTILPGLDGVVFRTKFYGPDGDQDWACAFAKGKVMVVVHTDRKDLAFNAVGIAKAIAGKF